jgi:polyisoprenoid-binding protein YceI
VDNFKEIFFHGHSLEKTRNAGEYILHGDLTMKGVTNAVELSVTFGGIGKDPWGNEKAGFSLEATINRKDWGLNWNAALETGGVLVGEDVTLDIEVQLGKQP